jgi:hypothetical protein
MRNFIYFFALLLFSCSDNVKSKAGDTEKSKANNAKKELKIQDNYIFYHEFKDKDSLSLGKAYISVKKDSVFNKLIILTDKNDTLYKVDNNKLFSIKGLDLKTEPDVFNGYKFTIIRNDYFSIVPVDKNGNGAADDIPIEWNYEKKAFEYITI